jgi:hypothetical protein
MKRLISLGLGLLLAMSVLGIAEAATVSDSIELYVTVTGDLSVTIIETGLSFGSVAADDTSVLTSSATVRNDSTGLTESYQIKGSNSVPSNWTLSSTPDEDQFVLYAGFSTAEPTVWTDDDLEVNNQNCTSDVFSEDGSHTGVGVVSNNPGDYTAAGSDRWLWFKIDTPTSLTVGSSEPQTITVTVTAY